MYTIKRSTFFVGLLCSISLHASDCGIQYENYSYDENSIYLKKQRKLKKIQCWRKKIVQQELSSQNEKSLPRLSLGSSQQSTVPRVTQYIPLPGGKEIVCLNYTVKEEYPSLGCSKKLKKKHISLVPSEEPQAIVQLVKST